MSNEERYKKALREIVKPSYGLQSIQEEYGDDVNAYNFHAMEYWFSSYKRLQTIAWNALLEED